MEPRPPDIAQILARLSISPKPDDLVGIIVPDSSNPFFSSLCLRLGRELSDRQYRLVVGCSEGKLSLESKLAGDLDRIGVRCMLLCSSHELTGERVRFLEKLSVPIIQVDRHSPQLSAPAVGFDNAQGGAVAARYAVQKNHRKVAMLPGPGGIVPVVERTRSFERVASQEGVECLVLEPGDLTFESGYARGLEFLPHIAETQVTCVFCANDCMAIGFMKAAAEQGIAVPGRLAIIGYDAIAVGQWLTPALTTIEQPLDELSAAAADLVASLIEGTKKRRARDTIAITPRLIARASA